MLIDSLVSFRDPATPLSVVAAAGVDVASDVVDLLGLGSGVVADNIIGNATVFGSDPGIDWPRIQAEILVTTAFTTGTAATANFAYQAAADDGAGSPDTWVTVIESGEIAVANMDAIGDIPWQFDLTPVHPLTFRPRFLRVLVQIPAGTLFTAGAIVIPTTTGLDQLRNLQQAANYSVGNP